MAGHVATAVGLVLALALVPPAQSGWVGCKLALTAFGCLGPSHTNQSCTLCAEQHHEALQKAGCTANAEKLLCGAGPPADAGLQKVLLEGTRCLDGTPAGFYWAPPTSTPTATSTDLWVIFLEGGGSCYDEAKCTQRARTLLGSSKNWPTTNNGSKSPFLQPDPGLNPDFHGAGRVFVPYCSGDTHVGNQSAATPATFGLWFTGAANLRAIVNDLQARRGMTPTAQVLLSGESAGAMGTFQMADWVASWLPPTAVVKAAPVSGWFMPAETGDFNGSAPDRRISRLPPSNYANFTAGRIGPWDNASTIAEDQLFSRLWNPLRVPGCTAALPANLAYLCRTMDSAYSYIKTPLFVIQNQFDSYQLITVMGLPQADHSSQVAQQYLEYYGRAQVLSASQVVSNTAKSDGLWLASCFAHTGPYMAKTAANMTINGTRLMEVVGDWFFRRNTMSHHIIDNCGVVPCNPACPH
eukprot:CAMPEP_0182918216 /NCGR_PEP_ID=MMETSP0105_2-20130417/1957_1 /TAXON_ID=81532 ORGANISM="Acanthoeca-like sp., Strain 10tr" /NCGR_SAMPLE_ID=MMETSP0105_2 /ASSEMBLY_ACC=CAM_ASM_000205 /LENGTH=466 /DNA_ID=CAMNT_0025055277 /DNA_START=11 /DNA_END=1411 /DNA_ORIENTATION=+